MPPIIWLIVALDSGQPCHPAVANRFQWAVAVAIAIENGAMPFVLQNPRCKLSDKSTLQLVLSFCW
jgi:hypothetical protein